jgi:hypothetical protein
MPDNTVLLADDQTTWHRYPDELIADHRLIDTIIQIQQQLQAGPLADAPDLNPLLPIQVRAMRRIESWRVLLLLTPWLFGRLFFPDQAPQLKITPDWFAAIQAYRDHQLLGPACQFQLFNQPQRAHLAIHPQLGHYLLQPLCLDMQTYQSPEDIFGRWNEVIKVRDHTMQQTQRQCLLQRDISRREFVTFQQTRSSS